MQKATHKETRGNYSLTESTVESSQIASVVYKLQWTKTSLKFQTAWNEQESKEEIL